MAFVSKFNDSPGFMHPLVELELFLRLGLMSGSCLFLSLSVGLGANGIAN